MKLRIATAASAGFGAFSLEVLSIHLMVGPFFQVRVKAGYEFCKRARLVPVI